MKQRMFGFLLALVMFFGLVLGFSPSVEAQEQKSEDGKQSTTVKTTGSWTVSGDVSFDGERLCKLLADCKILCTPPPVVSDCGGVGQPTCDVLKAQRRGWWAKHNEDFKALKKRVEVIEGKGSGADEISVLRETIEKIQIVVANDIRTLGLDLAEIHTELASIVIRLTELEDRMNNLEINDGKQDRRLDIIEKSLWARSTCYFGGGVEITHVATQPGLTHDLPTYDADSGARLADESFNFRGSSFAGLGPQAVFGCKTEKFAVGIAGSFTFGREDGKNPADDTTDDGLVSSIGQVSLPLSYRTSPELMIGVGPSMWGHWTRSSPSSSAASGWGVGAEFSVLWDFADVAMLRFGLTAGKDFVEYQYGYQDQHIPDVLLGERFTNDGFLTMFSLGILWGVGGGHSEVKPTPPAPPVPMYEPSYVP